MTLNAARFKELAISAGVDIVGIGDLDLFSGTDKEKDPRYIFPAAKSIIGLAFRVLRGTLRGNEEGTQFFQYPEMSVVHLDEIYIPLVLRKISCLLEDAGYEGVVLRSEPDRLKDTDPATNPEHTPVHKFSAIPVREGCPAPDVMIDFNQAAVICGLGEIGNGGFVLTEEFGPLQRFGYILTDLKLDIDEIKKPSLCDNCGKCMESCPGKAYSGEEDTILKFGKYQSNFKTPDSWQCAAYYMGASGEKNPFLSRNAFDGIHDAEAIYRGEKRLTPETVMKLKPILEDAYPGMRFGYNAAICGKACWRACMVHLEEQNKLKNKFKQPFRQSEEWKLKI